MICMQIKKFLQTKNEDIITYRFMAFSGLDCRFSSSFVDIDFPLKLDRRCKLKG